MSAHLWASWLASAILAYFLLSRTGNILLNLLSIRKLRNIERERLLADLPQLQSGLEQPISVLLPLQGTEKDVAVAAVRALLRLEHAAFELIVIHDADGNDTDDTMDALTRAFDLHPFPETYRMRIPTQAIRGIHRSTRHRNLRVVDKHAGGLADALNAGLNAARHPLFCGADTGMLLRSDCLQRLAVPFINERGIVATVAALHAANDAAIAGSLSFDKLALPRRWLPRLQAVELLRSALFAPLGWSVCNAMPHAPSSLSLLRVDAAMQAGGYDTAAVDPQAELILRLQRTLRAQGRQHGLRFVAEALCARETAASWADWARQRSAWQHGLNDALRRNRRWPPTRAGLAGWLAYPFTLLCEAWGPVIETFGYLFMLAALAFGLLPIPVFCAFLTVAIGFGILLSLSGVLLDDMALRSHPAGIDAATLALSAVLFNLGYAQLDAACRALATLRRPATASAG